MLTHEDNDLITRTDPGTPGGDLLRSYWQPVALSVELPEGGAPIAVRVMDEDLTLFRDEAGRIGLLGIHCAHRAADLSFGRIEDGGLRCVYHGWLYDVDGRCLEQPGEPAGPGFKDKVRQLAYPCQEVGGMVFGYLGSGEPPLLPAYGWLQVPPENRMVTKAFHDCNYAQGNEGNIDPQHVSFPHKFFSESKDQESRVPPGTSSSQNALVGQVLAPTIELEETDFGIRIYSVRPMPSEQQYVRITNFIMPNIAAFGGMASSKGEGYGVHWHVPIDDTHHWKYLIEFNRAGPVEISPERTADLLPNYHLSRNRQNRYLQDRDEMKHTSFIGLGRSFTVHDAFAVEGAGPIQDRSTEHLGYTDKAIVASRRMLLRGIHEVQEGIDPLHVVRNAEANHFSHLGACQAVIPSSEEWGSVWKRQLVPTS